MSSTRLHFLDARGRLGLNRPWLTRTVNDAMLRIRAMADPGDIDIAFRADTNVPAETGQAGQCVGAGQIVVAVDPANPQLTRNRDGGLQRTVAQECGLSIRRDGPGYGTTLGEIMASEGLALHFEACAFGRQTDEDPALAPMIDAALREAARCWDTRVFDHEAWFGGAKGGAIGHAAGYRLVRSALAAEKDATLVEALDWPAERFAPYAL